MKKKLLSVLLVVAMTAVLFAGCGTKDKNGDSDPASSSKNGSTEKQGNEDEKDPVVPEPSADEGKVLNIHCWNDEFQSRVKDFYPGYVHNDDGTGKIGDVTVNWIITPNQDNAYQNALDAALLEQDNASDDNKVDLFLIEADYALKYVNSDYSMDVTALGLTANDMQDQYQYTKDIVTDSNGNIKGTTWQATPGLFAYRRSIANDVLGTDDPVEVQTKLNDWASFNAVAADMKAKGYTMLSGYDDAYRTFSNNVAGPWVQGGKVVVDDNLMAWVDQTKEFTDNGYNNKTSLWSDGWSADQGPAGKTFGFFYSTWGINFTLLGNSLADSEADAEVGNGIFGDWAVCEGPQPYYWGGTWLCAATGTDNPGLVRDIMYNMTCNASIMKSITEETQDYTNNMTAMNEIANSDFSSAFLGGQNHIALFAEAAAKIDMSNISPYDQGCNEEFQGAFKDYFDGVVTKEVALDNFYKDIVVKYPELSY